MEIHPWNANDKNYLKNLTEEIKYFFLLQSMNLSVKLLAAGLICFINLLRFFPFKNQLGFLYKLNKINGLWPPKK